MAAKDLSRLQFRAQVPNVRTVSSRQRKKAGRIIHKRSMPPYSAEGATMCVLFAATYPERTEVVIMAVTNDFENFV